MIYEGNLWLKLLYHNQTGPEQQIVEIGSLTEKTLEEIKYIEDNT